MRGLAEYGPAWLVLIAVAFAVMVARLAWIEWREGRTARRSSRYGVAVHPSRPFDREHPGRHRIGFAETDADAGETVQVYLPGDIDREWGTFKP